MEIFGCRRVRRWLLLACAAPLAAGCRAERTLRITSEPAAAGVWVDDTYRGTTPLELPFDHYGTRRITFRLSGHGTTSLRVPVEPPWYGRFPLDLFSEVLIPVGWRDEHFAHAVEFVALVDQERFQRPQQDAQAAETLRSGTAHQAALGLRQRGTIVAGLDQHDRADHVRPADTVG